MINLFNFFNLISHSEKTKSSLSVSEIAEMMTPVAEESLRLPRSFAHNLSVIIQAEMDEQAYMTFNKNEVVSTEVHT
jgi:hypothetical protein